MTKQETITWLFRHTEELSSLSDKLWEHPEIKYEEFFAKDLLSGFLAQKGFSVTEKPAGIETAFTASFGSGHPIIGILGEYDALSGLSQQAGVCKPCPTPNSDNGHGCGHNLLGAASVLAACAIKKYLEENHLSGTVIFFGCPAEEGGSGKTFLAKSGVFDNLDAALTWHPADYNIVTSGSSLANVQIQFNFTGISAHAASAPHLGRSALDAVELMNVGANYLREHIIPEARLHYAITDTGGNMPGIVQSHAAVLYTIRAPKLTDVNQIAERLKKIAEGAALMTETTVIPHFVKATSNLIPNHTLEKLLYENMAFVPVPKADESEIGYGKELKKTMNPDFNSLQSVAERTSNAADAQTIRSHYGELFYDFLLPYIPFDNAQAYSTDVGDVSWICPTAQIAAATWVADSLEHTWQATAQGKSSFAHKGALYAAQVLSCTAIDLYTNPDICKMAKEELETQKNGVSYQSPLPENTDYRFQLTTPDH